MKLLTEVTQDLQYIKEEKEGQKPRLFIEGIFAQAEVANRNKRVYPMNILENEINRYNNESIKTNRATGELNHPSGPNINLDRVAISIKSLEKNGSNFHGKALVTDTPCGKIVEGLINSGVSLGVSTRALGSLKPLKEGLSEVQDDLRLLAIDVVADPSAPEAYVNAIMEGVEWLYDPSLGIWVNRIVEQTRNELKVMPVARINETVCLKAFSRFLNGLSNR